MPEMARNSVEKLVQILNVKDKDVPNAQKEEHVLF